MNLPAHHSSPGASGWPPLSTSASSSASPCGSSLLLYRSFLHSDALVSSRESDDRRGGAPARAAPPVARRSGRARGADQSARTEMASACTAISARDATRPRGAWDNQPHRLGIVREYALQNEWVPCWRRQADDTCRTVAALPRKTPARSRGACIEFGQAWFGTGHHAPAAPEAGRGANRAREAAEGQPLPPVAPPPPQQASSSAAGEAALPGTLALPRPPPRPSPPPPRHGTHGCKCS